MSQVNGISLIGETHKEVVRILKELPVCVYMTCCRPAPHMQTPAEPEQPQPEAPVLKVQLLGLRASLGSSCQESESRLDFLGSVVSPDSKAASVWGG